MITRQDVWLRLFWFCGFFREWARIASASQTFPNLKNPSSKQQVWDSHNNYVHKTVQQPLSCCGGSGSSFALQASSCSRASSILAPLRRSRTTNNGPAGPGTTHHAPAGSGAWAGSWSGKGAKQRSDIQFESSDFTSKAPADTPGRCEKQELRKAGVGTCKCAACCKDWDVIWQSGLDASLDHFLLRRPGHASHDLRERT